ncbi:MAG: site-2 protease family protein [Deltaproteobacteria bacterium]|nr:site-2 protease family protein [Deltaproteobacteria bacterium]
MLNVLHILIAILGLALLMVVHEAGHLLAARAFGMRVTTFSIGFGPTFFKIEPHQGYFWFTSLGGRIRLRLRKHDPEKHGPTVYQVAMIPFLAYVQIAGMNPFEDQEPEDKGSYANASLFGRITTIFGGPLANYLFASVLFFVAFYYGGIVDHCPIEECGTKVTVAPENPAEKAGLETGDVIVEVAGVEVDRWKPMASVISKHPEEPIVIVVDRKGERLSFTVTPKKKPDGKGIIGVALRGERRPVGAAEAAKLAVTSPPRVVRDLVVNLGDWISGKLDAELGGPVMIVKVSARAVRSGITDWLAFLGALSAYLGAFNLIPFPALDGGRMIFLGYELATRRRPNARVEAHIHIVGLMMLLGLMLYVTIFNDFGAGK